MTDNNNKKIKFTDLKGIHRFVPIILVSLAVFIAACFMLSGSGAAGQGINALLRGLFSYGAYAIPAVLCLQAICYADDLSSGKLKRRIAFFSLIVIFTSCIDYAISFWGQELSFSPALNFVEMNNGGFVGGVLGFLVGKLFGQIGIIIISLATLATFAIFFYAEKAGALGKAAISASSFVKKVSDKIKAKNKENAEKKKQLRAAEAQQRREVASEELLDDDFFSPKGEGDDVKVIDPKQEKVPEAVEEIPERKRKKADKPLDLSYGMEEGELSNNKKDKKPEFNNSFFGLDDSADNVFTKDFDPFDFATGEKTAAKYARKVSTISAAVEEELDEFTIYEMKANHVPTAREKRLADLERRKQEWLHEKKMREGGVQNASASPAADTKPEEVSARPLFDSVDDPAVRKAPAAYATSPEAFGAAYDPRAKRLPASATSAAAFGAAFDRSNNYTPATPAYTPAPPATPAASVESPSPAEPASPAEPTAPASPAMGGYSSPASAKPTYSRPIKTVEFTITKEPKPESAESPSAPKSVPMPEATEDVAILINRQIEKNNPTYMRSANDLKTYTKVVSTAADDELYRQLTGKSAEPAAADEEPKEAPSPVAEEAASLYESATATVTEDNLPEPVEFSFGEKDSSPVENSQSAYERAAIFASAMVNAPAEEIKPYTPPKTAFTPAADTADRNENTLKVERNMLPPEPTVTAPEVAESATTVTFSEDKEDKPASAPVAAEPLFSVVDEDDISFSPTEEISFDGEDDALDFDDEEDEADLTPEEIAEEETPDIEEIPPEKQNPDVIDMRGIFPFLDEEDKSKAIHQPSEAMAEAARIAPEIIAPLAETTAPAVSTVTETPVSTEIAEEEEEDVPFDDPVVKEPNTTSLVPAAEKKPEKKKPDYSSYEFPPLDFLSKENSVNLEAVQAETQENANKLIEALASFGVTASIKGVDRGPRITRYEVVPAKGVKVSQILNLQNDIALTLAAGDIRMEAPIPGKSAVGIEIPNKKPNTVRLRDLLETEEFRSEKSKTAVCIGRDVAGQPVFGDITKMTHLLVAGATGTGKSVCINSLLLSMLYKARPDEVKFIMIDPKAVEFTMYNGIPHLLIPIVTDSKQAVGALSWAAEEMDRRFNDMLNPLCVRNIDAYNEKIAANPALGEPMHKIVIIIDEFADIMADKKIRGTVEDLVKRITAKARASGIHLIIGTQRPSVDVITGTIKGNLPSRIACKVASNVDSRTILDASGAEKLLGMGDALYAPSGAHKPHRVQCAFVSDAEVETITNYLKEFGSGTDYDSSVMEEIERAAQRCSKKNGDRDEGGAEVNGNGIYNDRQFIEAVEIAVNTRKISTSLIQRKLSIGYGKAAKFIDSMEDIGIVGEANGQRPREVLITPDEWREKLARMMID